MAVATIAPAPVRTDVITLAEAARQLNVAEHTLRSWARMRLLRTSPSDDGLDRLIPAEEIEHLKSILPPF
ncbi:MAG: MerR family transcriptional regulator [Armatimonadota bacterium]